MKIDRRKLIKGAALLCGAALRPSKGQIIQFSGAPPASIFPIGASSTGPFLVTAQGQPFLMMADSAQAMATNIAGTDVDLYLSSRAAEGFNAIQFDLIAGSYISNNNANLGNINSVVPFSPAGPLPSPFSNPSSINSTYWNLMDSYVTKCLNNGLLAILNPYECHSQGGFTAGVDDLTNAGNTACTAYGTFLGSRYKSFPNVMWQLGNDLAISTSAQFSAVSAMASAILAADSNHLMTIELFYPFGNASVGADSTAFDLNGSLGSFSSIMNLNGVYTYSPTYGYCMIGYNKTTTNFLSTAGTNHTPQAPSILLESNYEFEHLANADGGALVNLRRQSYWSTLAGQSGQIYGNGYVWGFETSGGSNIVAPGGVGGTTGSWKNNLATPGAADLLRWKNFFTAINWQKLQPDQTHVVGTAGYGTGALTGSFASNNYVTVSADSLTGGAHLAVAYFPQGNTNTLTIDMTRFAGSVTAQWFDPTNASFTAVSGSPFANTGTHNFTPTGNNSAGDPDWVLLLTA